MEENCKDEDLKKILDVIGYIEEEQKSLIIYTLLGDKKNIYMNMLNMGLNYGIGIGSIIVYLFNPFGLAETFISNSFLDFLARIYGFFGSFLIGTASLMWVRKRKEEYYMKRESFEKLYNIKDKRTYFIWEK